jgi:hypothetical protein
MEKVRTTRFTAQQHLKAALIVPDRELKDSPRTTARLAHQIAGAQIKPRGFLPVLAISDISKMTPVA